jgi:thiol-disulfide isomerase/thioredoxin
MKTILALLLTVLTTSLVLAQNEQAPIIEKEITYKNWKYKDVRSGEETDLRSLAKGKKLVIAVYFAPWCGNWRHDAPFLERFYQSYRDKGLQIIGIGEYDPVASMKSNLDALKVSFPVVYESESRADKQKTLHYEYRKSTGDNRNWGSPWYILMQPSMMEKKGDVLVKKAHIINGEMIEAEGERFIRQKLGLPVADIKDAGKAAKVEVCDPNKPAATLTTVATKPL